MVVGLQKEEEFNLFFMYEDYISLVRPDSFEIEEISESHSKFSIYPVQKGFGSTIANSLRRVLLSSIRGVKISSVSINGVSNEFSSINGIKNDVMSICANLQKVILKMDGSSSCEGKISVFGPKVVYASDITLPVFVQVLNPNLELFTITENVKFDATLSIISGIGSIIYDANDLAGKKSEIGRIYLDCYFSPVKNVSFNITNTRFESSTDFDKILLDVKTDGSITPVHAVSISSALIRDFFKKFVTFEEDLIAKKNQESVNSDKSYDPRLIQLISTLELSVRSSNCLSTMGLVYIGDLVVKEESELLKYQNFGNKSLTEVKSALSGIGLSLGMNVKWPVENIDELVALANTKDSDILA
jgi:DNA-directed RNA polymerase subunit alpha